MISNTYLFTLVIVLFCLLIASILFNVFYMQKKLLVQVQTHTQAHGQNSHKVCMSQSEYQHLTKSAKPVALNYADQRDRRVMTDDLYPALNRSETGTHNGIVSQIVAKKLYTNTQEFTDNFRMVGYVTNPEDKQDSGGNTWKLLARQKNRNQADFFMIPANNNYSMKIMLNNDIVVGNDKLQDIYTIPKTLQFKSPLLNETPYEVVELPMTDFTNSYN
jgi:hypothetical protein